MYYQLWHSKILHGFLALTCVHDIIYKYILNTKDYTDCNC